MKKAGYEVDNRIRVVYSGDSAALEKFKTLIAKETLAEEITKTEKISDVDLEKIFEIDGEKIQIGIKKI